MASIAAIIGSSEALAVGPFATLILADARLSCRPLSSVAVRIVLIAAVASTAAFAFDAVFTSARGEAAASVATLATARACERRSTASRAGP
eukprot:611410-Pleurochrysis_carterae.AAC.1